MEQRPNFIATANDILRIVTSASPKMFNYSPLNDSVRSAFSTMTREDTNIRNGLSFNNKYSFFSIKNTMSANLKNSGSIGYTTSSSGNWQCPALVTAYINAMVGNDLSRNANKIGRLGHGKDAAYNVSRIFIDGKKRFVHYGNINSVEEYKKLVTPGSVISRVIPGDEYGHVFIHDSIVNGRIYAWEQAGLAFGVKKYTNMQEAKTYLSDLKSKKDAKGNLLYPSAAIVSDGSKTSDGSMNLWVIEHNESVLTRGGLKKNGQGIYISDKIGIVNLGKGLYDITFAVHKSDLTDYVARNYKQFELAVYKPEGIYSSMTDNEAIVSDYDVRDKGQSIIHNSNYLLNSFDPAIRNVRKKQENIISLINKGINIDIKHKKQEEQHWWGGSW